MKLLQRLGANLNLFSAAPHFYGNKHTHTHAHIVRRANSAKASGVLKINEA